MNPRQRQAVRIADEVMAGLRIRAGQTEEEIAAWIVHEIRSRGAEPSFKVIVASGIRSIDPHAKPSKNKIKKGEQVMVDLGAKYKGYCSDITRMFFVGRPTKKYLHYFNIVKTAQRLAIKAVRAGVDCREIDLTAREYIKRHCYKACHLSEKECPGECFIHTTGHGVGRKIHQFPRLSLKSRAKLKAGMVVTVEPGIYIKGFGGIRIEDMVLVTKEGQQILTR
ncbi:MAG: M24 family metallopeptidase [Candidatus Margulisiibacteriota bacterium]|jgi:Xaa-Pro aminopeptidase